MRAACCLLAPLFRCSPLRLLSSFPFYRVSFSQPPSSLTLPSRLRRRGRRRTAGSRILVSFVRSLSDGCVRFLRPYLSSPFFPRFSIRRFLPTSTSPHASHACCLLSFIPELMAYYDSGAQSQPKRRRLVFTLDIEAAEVGRGILRITFSEASFPSPGRRRRRRVAYS